jgi:hypothetical protein
MRQQVNGAKISPSERVKNPFVSAMINRKKKKIVRALQNDIVFMFYFIFYSLDNEKKMLFQGKHTISLHGDDVVLILVFLASILF